MTVPQGHNGISGMHRDAEGKAATRLVVVDDHPVVAAGIIHLLADEPDLMVAGHATDPVQALACMADWRPDLVISDLNLGKSMDGIDFIRALRQKLPAVLVLVLSMHDDPHYVRRAFSAGVNGYMVKDDLAGDIITAVRTVLRRENYLSRAVAVANIWNDPLASLSEREMTVLRLTGTGLETKEIAAELNLSPKTVETYRQRLKLKLGIESHTELLAFSVQHVHKR